MRVCLKRIKRTEFDTLIQEVLDSYNKNQIFKINDDVLEKASEKILIEGKEITFSYDVDEYLKIASSNDMKYMKQAQIGMKLHKESKDINGIEVPTYIMHEKEVWAYLTFKVFLDVVYALDLKDNKNITDDKLKKVLFNSQQKSRTCLLFLWTMIDMLNSENDEEITRVAFHFIDPVRAIYERAFSRNDTLLRAFVEAIIKNDCDSRIKNSKYKVRVPNNVSCFARISMVDIYEYNKLVDTIAKQIKDVIEMDV